LDIVIKYCLKNKNIDKVLCDLKWAYNILFQNTLVSAILIY
jgi:hypothetical protein